MAWMCVLQVVDPSTIHRGGSAHDAVHLVALLQKELGEIRAVLPRDAGNQRPSWHGKSLGFRGSRMPLTGRVEEAPRLPPRQPPYLLVSRSNRHNIPPICA